MSRHTPPEKRKRQRERLWVEAGGKCFWCDEPTHFSKGEPGRGAPKGMTKADFATTDHIVSRFFHRDRVRVYRKRRRNVVLACRTCNAKRAQVEERLLRTVPERARASALAESILINELVFGVSQP